MHELLYVYISLRCRLVMAIGEPPYFDSSCGGSAGRLVPFDVRQPGFDYGVEQLVGERFTGDATRILERFRFG